MAIQRAFLHHAARQRLMNIYIANVPGPPVPLHLAGAPLAEAFPVVPIMGNVPICGCGVDHHGRQGHQAGTLTVLLPAAA